MTETARSAGPDARWALFSLGFRPFFLFAAIWGALVVLVWVASLLAGDGVVAGGDGRAWHIHEMLFGYLGGVIAGFLLTAVPNWTGRPPMKGASLAALVALWAAGRAVNLGPEVSSIAATVLDCAFSFVLAAVIWREVIAARNFRNLPVCLLVTMLAVANLAFHLRGPFPQAGAGSERAGLAVAAGLIALIGGRLVPNFTGNWLAAQGLAPGPAAFGRVDQAVLALTGVALAGWVFAPLASPVGVLLIAVGGGHLLRLARWRGWKTASEPLVWILHAGYGWLGLGLALLGASVLAPDLAPRSAGVHAIAVGAVGVMTLAVMTRATLGHTGRPLAADRWTLGVYLAILLAAVARVSAALDPSHASLLLGLSAGLWATAFLGFALRYGPMLVLPRRVAPLRT